MRTMLPFPILICALLNIGNVEAVEANNQKDLLVVNGIYIIYLKYLFLFEIHFEYENCYLIYFLLEIVMVFEVHFFILKYLLQF